MRFGNTSTKDTSKDANGREQAPTPLCDVSLNDGLDLRFHFIDEHGLSRTVPKDAKHLGTTTPCSGKEQVPPSKRKAPGDSAGLSWPSPEQFSPTHPPKKVRRCSSTVTPSLLSNIDAGKLCPTSPIGLTWSDPSTSAPEATPPLRAKEGHQSENCLELGPTSSVRSQSCERTVVDDSIFSQFIRSPSPDDIPTMMTADQARQSVVDKDDIISSSNSSFSETGLSHHDSDPDHPPGAPMGTHQKLRICLRVEPPKTKIKLRVSMQKGKESNKRLPPRKKPRENGRQPSRKKRSIKRR